MLRHDDHLHLLVLESIDDGVTPQSAMVKHGISTSVPGDNIEKRAPTLRMCNKSPAALSSNRADCGKPLGGMAVADEANGELLSTSPNTQPSATEAAMNWWQLVS